MRFNRRHACCLLLLSLTLAAAPAEPGRGADPALVKRASSPIAVSPDGAFLVTANPDSDSVSVLDLRDGAVRLLAEVPVGRHPGTVAVSGDTAYATAFEGDALFAFGLSALRRGRPEVRAVALRRNPYGVVVSPDGGRVYVAETGAGTIAVLDARSLQVLDRVAVGGRPRGLALAEARLYATDFLSGALFELDAGALELTKTLRPRHDANLAFSVVPDPQGEVAALPHTRPDTANAHLTFETTVFPTVSLVDLRDGIFLSSFRIDLHVIDQPVSIPIDAVWGEDDRLYVLHASSNDLSVLNLASFEREAHVATGEHPRGIAIAPDGARLFVNNTLDGTVSVFDAHTLERRDVRVTAIPLPADVWLGKVLFHSADRPELAKNQWISCAVCHFDGGMDGRTWVFPDGPRNTPSLRGAAETLPAHWSGDLDELADVERTVRVIQAGTGLVDAETVCEPTCDQSESLMGRSRALDALVAYLRTLNAPEPPPVGDDPELEASIARGRAVFLSQEAGCAVCHTPSLYTDRSKHDVGTAVSPLERNGSAFDTPSLRGLHATAPYLHDGSAATLRDVLTRKNPADAHGVTSQLSEAELDDLIQFLRSL